MGKPLDGVKILDFTQFFAGPYCTLLLEDMGAEVIKLENPPMGDTSRTSAIIANGANTNYAVKNRGKKSVLMNLKDERQKALFLEMVKTADAVVENYKPGTFEKFGITYELLSSINPRIVLTSISGYGQEGPYSDYPALDGAIQAVSGAMSITGEIGGRPLRSGVAIGDAAGGLYGAIGTLGALYKARISGKGSRVDIAMLDCMVAMEENIIARHCYSGEIPERIGNGLQTAVPFNTYECRDGQSIYICIASDSQFKIFAEAMRHPEWAEDEKYSSKVLRVKNRRELDEAVSEAIRTEWSLEELSEMLRRNKLPFGEINTLDKVVTHPQVQYRKMLVDVEYPNGAKFQIPGNPIKMSGIEDVMVHNAYPLGYHTMEVMREFADEATLHEIYDGPLSEAREKMLKMYSKG